MTRHRGLTVGDVVTAAVKQGKAIDFAFIPLTAAEKQMSAEELCDQVMGPVLVDLGLNKEDAMGGRFNTKNAEQEKMAEELASVRRYRGRARKELMGRIKVWLVDALDAA